MPWPRVADEDAELAVIVYTYVYLDIYKDTYICCRFFVRATHVTFCDGRNMSKWWQFDDGSKVIYIQLVYVNKFTWLLEFAIALCMGELQLSDYTQLQMGMTVNSESCWWMITDEIATCFNINVLKPRELQRELERYSNETTDFTGTFQRGTLQFLNYHTMTVSEAMWWLWWRHQNQLHWRHMLPCWLHLREGVAGWWVPLVVIAALGDFERLTRYKSAIARWLF